MNKIINKLIIFKVQPFKYLFKFSSIKIKIILDIILMGDQKNKSFLCFSSFEIRIFNSFDSLFIILILFIELSILCIFKIKSKEVAIFESNENIKIFLKV